MMGRGQEKGVVKPTERGESSNKGKEGGDEKGKCGGSGSSGRKGRGMKKKKIRIERFQSSKKRCGGEKAALPIRSSWARRRGGVREKTPLGRGKKNIIGDGRTMGAFAVSLSFREKTEGDPEKRARTDV